MLLEFHSLTILSWICLTLHPFLAAFYQHKKRLSAAELNERRKNLWFHLFCKAGKKQQENNQWN